MSNLLFKKTVVEQHARRVMAQVIKSRKREAMMDWKNLHRQGFWSRLLFGKKPIPNVDPKWLKEHIENNALHGSQFHCAESFINYCKRPDAHETIAVSREDSETLWLV